MHADPNLIERLYQSVFEHTENGVFLTRPDGTVLRANPAACRLLGRTEESLTTGGRASIIVESPSVHTMMAEREARHLTVGELEFVRGDGSTFPVEVTSTLFRGPDGDQYGCTIFRDISRRTHAEEALREREYLLSESQRIAHIGSWVWDLATNHVVWSDEVYRIYGVDRDTPLTREFLASVVHPDDLRATQQWTRACSIGECPGTIDFRIVRADGDVRFVQGRGELVPGSGIKPPRMIGTFQDVTESKRAEEERERLATAIAQVAEAVVVTDARGIITYVNPAFEGVTGYSRDEVCGQNPRILKSGTQDEATYRDLWATITSGRTWSGRLVNRKKDGTTYTEESTISPVRDAAGTITSYVNVKRDVSQHLALEAQLMQAQKMEGIGRLASGVAHDFNNILSVIQGYTELALETLREGDPLRDDIQEIARAGERASVLTRQLLAFSRKQVLNPVSLDLNQVLSEIEKMLHRIIGEDIDLVKRLAPDLGLARADLGQIEQVIMNLATNARDAMPDGGRLTIESANVELDADYARQHPGAAPGSYVMLAVTDTGTGMDAATMARVFDPFFTTKPSGKGTGLGLSTVYGIVKQSGGSVYVYSEPGKGTTFKVYLPRDGSSPVPEAHQAKTAVRAACTETVLVVEDDESVRTLAKRILEGAGYTVVTAASGAEALRICRTAPGVIHLVLTDVVMPQMSGQVFCAHLASIKPGIKVVYMSGYADNAIVRHGILDAGIHFIGKPLTQADLLRKVRDVLDGAE